MLCFFIVLQHCNDGKQVYNTQQSNLSLNKDRLTNTLRHFITSFNYTQIKSVATKYPKCILCFVQSGNTLLRTRFMDSFATMYDLIPQCSLVERTVLYSKLCITTDINCYIMRIRYCYNRQYAYFRVWGRCIGSRIYNYLCTQCRSLLML